MGQSVFQHDFNENLVQVFGKSYAFWDSSSIIDFDKELRHFLQIIFTPEITVRKYNDSAFPSLNVMHNGAKVEEESWGKNIGSNKDHYYSKPESLLKALELKCTLILNEYSRYSDIAKIICQNIEQIVPCHSSCNAYFSQHGGKGFKRHADAHHVVIIAVSGIKEWIIYKEKVHPLSAHYGIMPKEDGESPMHEVLDTVIMYPGDVLYIPQGQFHEVNNLSNNALHLTCSIGQKTCLQFLYELLDAAKHCDQMGLSEKTNSILAQPHPVHLHNHPLTSQKAIDYLKGLIPALNDITTDSNFLSKVSQDNYNKLHKLNDHSIDYIIDKVLSMDMP